MTQTAPQKPTQARPIEKEWKNKFAFKSHAISEKHAGFCPYELSGEYPEAVSSAKRVKGFNRWIKRKVLADVARFRWLELRAEPRSRRERKRSITEGLELTFLMYYSDDDLISFRLTHSVMAAGQMHPIAYYETINYDLRKGRPLRAYDIFKRGYLKTLSDYSRKSLRETYDLSAEDWLMEGTAPRARNFPDWNIVPDGILISFEDYQVGSHSFGQPELIVPYSVLKRSLRGTKLIRPLVTQRSKTISRHNQRDPSPRLSDIFVGVSRLSYRGYTVSKLHKRVKLVYPPEYDNPPEWADATYAVVRRNRRTLSTFDSGLSSPLVNSTEFGLFPFLGGKTKQLVVSQDLPRTGTQWVAAFSRRFRIIFDGPAWRVGRESDDMGIIDLDHDGVCEITVPITDFYGLQDKMSMAQIPLPEIVFKYDPKRGKYLPANQRFQDYELEGTADLENVSTGDEFSHRSIILGRFLDLIYAGKQKDAWDYFERAYKLKDKVEIKHRVKTILTRQPVYNFIYNRGKNK